MISVVNQISLIGSGEDMLLAEIERHYTYHFTLTIQAKTMAPLINLVRIVIQSDFD